MCASAVGAHHLPRKRTALYQVAAAWTTANLSHSPHGHATWPQAVAPTSCVAQYGYGYRRLNDKEQRSCRYFSPLLPATAAIARRNLRGGPKFRSSEQNL